MDTPRLSAFALAILSTDCTPHPQKEIEMQVVTPVRAEARNQLAEQRIGNIKEIEPCGDQVLMSGCCGNGISDQPSEKCDMGSLENGAPGSTCTINCQPAEVIDMVIGDEECNLEFNHTPEECD